jgi:hypothetical protein
MYQLSEIVMLELFMWRVLVWTAHEREAENTRNL